MSYFKRYRIFFLLLLIIGVYSCASIGQPDGGEFDEVPPKFVKSSPAPFTVNFKGKKITIEFDENVKIEKASEKVIVSPPQLEMPEIKAVGKNITVELQDTIKANTTYNIDFADAIVDNNEGNPLGNFALTFSTGSTVDSMEVSGTVLNAKNLEPIKGILVGLHSDLADSAFVKKSFERVGRTDGRGHFTVRGVAPGKYRIYALMDGNQNSLYDSKSEMMAFGDSLIIPSMMSSERQDTLWKDSVHIDTIKTVKYTRFLPDNIILKAFRAENDRQFFVKSQRDKENHFILQFSAKADTLPALKGLNFDERDAFIIEKTNRNDSICYWIKDSLLCNQDTLEMKMDYLYSDSLGNLVPKCDTLLLVNKFNKEQREKFAKVAKEEKEKERKKKSKKGEEYVEPTAFLKMNAEIPQTFDLGKNIVFSFEEPVSKIDTAAVHLKVKQDTIWKDEPLLIMEDSIVPRRYNLLAEWLPEKEYEFTMDSLAITGLYGLKTDKYTQKFKIKKLEDYGTLYLNIVGADNNAIVEMLDNKEEVVSSVRIGKNGAADFYFLKPETKYYIRLFNDRNNNGIWDPGNFEKGIQAEEVYYFPKSWQMKANFEFNESWDINATSFDRQKLNEIKKQKPDEAKKIRDRNKERARKLAK